LFLCELPVVVVVSGTGDDRLRQVSLFLCELPVVVVVVTCMQVKVGNKNDYHCGCVSYSSPDDTAIIIVATVAAGCLLLLIVVIVIVVLCRRGQKTHKGQGLFEENGTTAMKMEDTSRLPDDYREVGDAGDERYTRQLHDYIQSGANEDTQYSQQLPDDYVTDGQM